MVGCSRRRKSWYLCHIVSDVLFSLIVTDDPYSEEALVGLGVRGGSFYPYPTHREANFALSAYIRSIFE